MYLTELLSKGASSVKNAAGHVCIMQVLGVGHDEPRKRLLICQRIASVFTSLSPKLIHLPFQSEDGAFLPHNGPASPLTSTVSRTCVTFLLACRYSFFPQLRATADLLMMPKEVLTDRTIRAEVLPGLSLSRICAILERFQPDDFAADPLPRGMTVHKMSSTEDHNIYP